MLTFGWLVFLAHVSPLWHLCGCHIYAKASFKPINRAFISGISHLLHYIVIILVCASIFLVILEILALTLWYLFNSCIVLHIYDNIALLDLLLTSSSIIQILECSQTQFLSQPLFEGILHSSQLSFICHLSFWDSNSCVWESTSTSLQPYHTKKAHMGVLVELL